MVTRIWTSWFSSSLTPKPPPACLERDRTWIPLAEPNPLEVKWAHGALASTALQPKHGAFQPPAPKAKSWSRWAGCCAAVQPDVGPHSHSLATLGAPTGAAQHWLDRKQRRRGKSEGSSSELFNTSLYCLCFWFSVLPTSGDINPHMCVSMCMKIYTKSHS